MNILAANGFGRGNLTVAEAGALYSARYHVLTHMRLPSSGDWKMADNAIGVPPPPGPSAYASSPRSAPIPPGSPLATNAWW